ncbi:ATP-binding cassette domain-containing protein [Galactobacter caseinivorans]|uniref:ATP-binding cassette domain-containing protein n=1 Tax=Galactobacter caseinivorans TaxID=2676123 RepID=A0A496PHZ6_9MICC|nr:ATP-binding cassette domain-containing protein [Galactobacter caseinivorans]RKW70116.1 ATP-binding cassette domain-containing protein [Galactobacter caseinivorans]
MGLLAGVLKPSDGRIALQISEGQSPLGARRKEYLRRVSWVPQAFSPVGGLSVLEHVEYSGWLKGMPAREAKLRAPEALKLAGLEDLAVRPAASLSGGQTQRLGLAGAYVHDADVLLLDEPTVGLDMAQRERFTEVLRAGGADRITVMSTHDTAGIESFVDRVVVMRRGAVAFDGTLDEFLIRAPESAGSDQQRLTAAYVSVMEGDF